ncbi:biotin transport system substrate-specific component [Oikeobacillus pervagus]|uniref:Biotin transporter n=1 Tax=Oikeobacillus pervagus TaxID=1325931 RepID=A0AAJ1T4R9_9BACI|nr:biotin transporter BioY [Oikeobacillus pervagus]MDQ0216742.1 biotin transport system substrate-specific component [Oikeobacillus pervagus]
MKAREIVICALFAALMGVGANVSPFLTIGGVPITLQLMFAILAGGILGSRLGAISMTAYMFIGLAGAPVFAQFKGGPASLLSPTFGFVISFILIAYDVGKFFEQKKRSLFTYIGAGSLAIIINYFIGTNYMYIAFKYWAEAPDSFSYIIAWSWMAAYFPLDTVVTICSLVFIPKLQKALNRQPLQNQHTSF